jgi:hypothetical protein
MNTTIAEGVSLDDFEQVTSNERRAAGKKEGADRPADDHGHSRFEWLVNQWTTTGHTGLLRV